METVTCPKCGKVNPANAINCQSCKVNLAYALANLDEFKKPSTSVQESPATIGYSQDKYIQRWEYCELAVVIGGPLSGTVGKLVWFKTDGKHFRNETPDYGVFMANLGEEGWELVTGSARTDAGLGGKHVINYMFKRKKRNASEG